MAWSDDAEELKHIRNDVGSQLASMECVPRHNTIDCPTLFWAAMPGNAADFPAEESFHTFIEQAVCLFTEETNYRSSLSPFGIKMVDRLNKIQPISVAWQSSADVVAILKQWLISHRIYDANVIRDRKSTRLNSSHP